MSSALPRRAVLSEEVLIQPLRDEAMMLDLEHEVYHRMNDIALRIWQLLREQPDVETVVALLLDEYEVDEAALREDVGALLRQWEESGLVTLEA